MTNLMTAHRRISKILDTLEAQPMNIMGLAQVVGLTKSAVRKQVTKLMNAGCVITRMEPLVYKGYCSQEIIVELVDRSKYVPKLKKVSHQPKTKKRQIEHDKPTLPFDRELSLMMGYTDFEPPKIGEIYHNEFKQVKPDPSPLRKVSAWAGHMSAMERA
jgi:predicted transcriptional regulator